VDETPHAGRGRGGEDVPRAVDGDTLEVLPRAPVADLGRGVITSRRLAGRLSGGGDVAFREIDVLCISQLRSQPGRTTRTGWFAVGCSTM
jgi:hypothetical protein